LEYFLQTFINMVDGYKLLTICGLIGLDFVLGVVVALKDGTFQLEKIASFLNTSVLYFLGGYLVLGAAATIEPSIDPAWVTGAWVLLDATMVGFVVTKLKKLGVPIPDDVAFLKFPTKKT
jgi:hypothetical protein